MRIIGCDLHARQQTLAMMDTETGEVVSLTLMHEGDQVREFYSQLPRPVLVGIEATGSMHWFLNLMEELGIECRVGHPATIRAAEPRKQKHDRRDADLILKLLVEKRFPAIWLPTKELLDLRALLLHRHQWVRMRTRIQNALQAIALANGLRRGPRLWSYDGQAKIAFLPLLPHAAYRRSALQAMYRKMEEEIENLSQQVAEQAGQRSGARRLMTHPGVGPVTALATDVFLGDPKRFADGKALASYVGIIPREYSSGEHQRFGGVTKQGSPLLRFLWCEAGAHAVRRDPELKRFYRRKLVQKGLGKARVAVAAFQNGQLHFHGNVKLLAQPKTFAAWLRPLHRQDWVVYLKRPFGGPEYVVHYLGRYTHRVAISNHRLVSFTDGQVTFRWRDSAHHNEQKLLTLSLDEFLRRFLLHILPKGFVRIRNFGFLANRKRAKLLPLCLHLLGATQQPQLEAHASGTKDSPPSRCCPKCGGPMRVIERFTAAELQLRSPPRVCAAA